MVRYITVNLMYDDSFIDYVYKKLKSLNICESLIPHRGSLVHGQDLFIPKTLDIPHLSKLQKLQRRSRDYNKTIENYSRRGGNYKNYRIDQEIITRQQNIIPKGGGGRLENKQRETLENDDLGENETISMLNTSEQAGNKSGSMLSR